MATKENDLPTQMECPQCNAPMKPFTVQSRNPGVDVELDRCHTCGGVWFDAGELEVATGRTVIKSMRASDRYCPRCFIPLLNAELTAGVAVESCRTCKGTYLDARDMHTVTKQSPVKPPEDVSFVCESCGQRKPFANAQATSHGTECNDCFVKNGSVPASQEANAHASVFSSFVGWLRGDSEKPRDQGAPLAAPAAGTLRACPGCTAPMRVFAAGKVELDRCTYCHGLWFDGGELEQVLGKKLTGTFDQATVTSRKCAQCNVQMRTVVLGGIQVEVCTTCRGVFLDDGELVLLNGGQQVRVQAPAPSLARSQAQAESKPPPPKPAARSEAQVKDDVMGWLETLGA